ncbi:hypothetical protein AOQ84DRAFT_282736 [Glonium stellatum]|uniref:F-box domain-containing protein n=1 Tax=Glonium stellatum TaxID=574774 RepID=A0A8E2FAH8_9PEZI|nr:hypothetical protein AOQ84DRAFT_282736 [Glonium stellatum]
MASPCYLYMLPNELLLHILTPLPTPTLLPLTIISHRIYALVLRILHNRLLLAATLHDHSLILECYHPSAKLTEPPYFCTYHGTEGLDAYEEPTASDSNLVPRLGQLRNMYSRFRPYRRELGADGHRVKKHPAGDVPGSRTHPSSSAAGRKLDHELVRQILSLDGEELFTQLCAVTNLVKIGPRNGLFSCFVEVEEGVVRVWRNWLKEMAAREGSTNSRTRASKTLITEEEIDIGRKGKEAAQKISSIADDLNDENILWVSSARNTGLRFKIRERKLKREAPILMYVDEDTPLSYEIEYDELLVRTSHLLLKFENSLVQQDNSFGKAIVFGSFG